MNSAARLEVAEERRARGSAPVGWPSAMRRDFVSLAHAREAHDGGEMLRAGSGNVMEEDRREDPPDSAPLLPTHVQPSSRCLFRRIGARVALGCGALCVLSFACSSATAGLAGAILGEAARSGLAGAGAMVINVACFMWLRTVMNYQQAHAAPSIAAVVRHLHREGGVRRFYRGVVPALVQGPLARFGDTASNACVTALRDAVDPAGHTPTAVTTGFAALLSAGWRIVITPVDTIKTALQVHGRTGWTQLQRKVDDAGVASLWDGALGAAAATALGYYPWWLTYNLLEAALPTQLRAGPAYIAAYAAIGLAASVVSDVSSNALRVLKVVKQTSAVALSYRGAYRQVVREEGCGGLCCRGLRAKLLTNALQAAVFSLTWRLLQDAIASASRPLPAH